MFKYEDYVFRKVCESDAAELLSLRESAYLNFHSTTIQNLNDQIEWIQNIPDDEILFVVDHRSKDYGYGSNINSIGYFYLSKINYINLSANASWGLYERFRKKNLGKNLVNYGLKICTEVLNLRKIGCEILTTNVPSRICAINAGFKSEGTKRKAVYKMGSYIDSEIFGFSRKDV